MSESLGCSLSCSPHILWSHKPFFKTGGTALTTLVTIGLKGGFVNFSLCFKGGDTLLRSHQQQQEQNTNLMVLTLLIVETNPLSA